MQPTMYGAAEKTALEKGFEDSSIFNLPYKWFMEGFKVAMPGSFRLLKYLREFTNHVVKAIRKDPSNPAYRTLQYQNPFGTQCRITSFKRVKDENGKHVPYAHSFSLGRRRDISVPIKVLDPEEIGSSLIAAFSHQYDSSAMAMMHVLVREMKKEAGIEDVDGQQSTHDDFLDHGNYGHFIDKAAVQVIKFHWELDGPIALFCNQITDNMGIDAYTPFNMVSDKSQFIDWTKVQPFN